MKKLATDYFGWVILFLAIAFMLALSSWIMRMGFNYSSKMMVDLTGIGLISAAGFLLVVELWELSLLINLLKVELQGVKIIDGEVIVLKKRHNEIRYRIKDVIQIEFFDRVFGSKALTQHLTYSKIKFKSGDIIYITSFTLNLAEVEKLFPNKGIKKIRRERKFFELVK